MRRILAIVFALATSAAEAQDFGFEAPARADDANTMSVMRDLAERILPVYEEQDREQFLANLSALQLVAGEHAAAHGTRDSLRERRQSTGIRPDGRALLLDVYAQARDVEAHNELSFSEAFTQVFREVVPGLSDQDAAAMSAWVGTPLASFQDRLQQSFDRLRGQQAIAEPEAIELVWTYLAFDAYRSAAPLLETLAKEDDQRRYLVEEDVSIKLEGGATIHARVVRPKHAAKAPALLEFTLFGADNDAKACAAHGYAGVVAYARGKDSHGNTVDPARVAPFEHDGADARAVIRWIVKQPWSDGRVGMFGAAYAGYAAWAAAKQPPAALMAIATYDAMAPGIDFPMEGRVFRNSAYRWAVASAQADAAVEDEEAQWGALDRDWYKSGKPYRDLDRIAKKPSAIFQRWLEHPNYDLWWQKMIPFRDQFVRVNVPVLSVAGPSGSAEVGSMWYFSEHVRYNERADHTLVIGAYDDLAPIGFAVDPVARVDLRELRFQWFDHVFNAGPRPALLQDRVNYQMAGANEWRHAASLEAMANGSAKLYLDGANRRLVSEPLPDAVQALSVDLSDRGDAGWPPPSEIVSKDLPIRHGTSFTSEPFAEAVEVAGLLSGEIDFTVNKRDMDLNVTLYELQPGGDYLQLADPYEFRASYARDPIHRRLLKPGKRQQLTFKSTQIASRRLQPGSRLILVLGVNKRPDRQLNYGSGKSVARESLADGRTPLKVQWYGTSFVEIPVRR